MEEDNNLDDVVQDELDKKNRKPEGRIKRKLRKEAKRKMKNASRKARKKLSKTLLKRVSLTSFIGFLPLLIILFMIIGIISFITSMPGFVQEKIMNTVFEKISNFKYDFEGTDYYLAELARDSDNTAQKNVLKYLDDMGIDPVGFGFAPFYTRNGDQIDYSPNIAIDDVVANINEWSPILGPFKDLGGFKDSINYNDRLAQKVAKEDLIFKYIISNERTYLVDDNKKPGNWEAFEKIKDWLGKVDFKGMIKTSFDGLTNDSKLEIDRENKSMSITSTNWSNFQVQTAKYDLDSWVGRYGMSLEFLLALHIATMSSDLTEEMITNDNLQTEVKIDLDKRDYNVDYEFIYKGNQFNLGNKAFLSEYDESMIKVDENGNYSMPLTDEQKEYIKNNADFTSIAFWLQNFRQFNSVGYTRAKEVYTLTHDAKDALLSEDAFRVAYHIPTISTLEYPGEWTVYLGKPQIAGDNNYEPRLSDKIKNLITAKYDADTSGGKYLGQYNIKETVGPDEEKAILEEEGREVESFVDKIGAVYRIYDDNYNSEYLPTYYTYKSNADIPLEEVKVDNVNMEYASSGGTMYHTGVMHGIEYYMQEEHTAELKNEAEYLGMISILSQLDAYLYEFKLEETDIYKTSGLSFTPVQHSIGGGNELTYISGESIETGLKLGPAESFEAAQGTQIYFLLTKHWIDFCNSNGGIQNCTDIQIRNELERLRSYIEYFFEATDSKDGLLPDETIQQLFDELIEQAGLEEYEGLTVSEILTVFDLLVSGTSEEFELALPKIDYVIRHWYKDIIFDLPIVHDSYSNSESMRIPLNFDNEDLQVTAIISGGDIFKQTDQPLVVKGDIVTLDGEVVEDSVLGNGNYTIENEYSDTEYTIGDGYRTTKKLFTQGQYYVFDGTEETSKSIYYAKELEKLNGVARFAKVYVRGGRIILVDLYENDDAAAEEMQSAYDFVRNTWNAETQIIDEKRKDENLGDAILTGDGWTAFLYRASVSGSTNEDVNCYFVRADKTLKYISAADDVIESKESVERINDLLLKMGVITIRKPISFDNTTATGDVTTLTAFGILEGMHTESSEHIYRDLKEFLVELGYYTKAEFEQIETNVLQWFIPDYLPETEEERVNWKQNKEEDLDLYGALIYPTEVNDEGDIVHKGFEPDLDVIAPGNCRVIGELSEKTITLEFDGISQPEIGMLDKYTMIIEGINVSTDVVEVEDSDGNTYEQTIQAVKDSNGKYIIKAGQVIGKTGDVKIQIILKNNRGGYIDNIEDYMGPEKSIISGDGTYFSITGTVLTTEEFTNACLDYMNANGISNSDFTEESLKEFYKICKKKGVNPELAFVTALIESANLMAGEATSTHNYWGLDTPNGSSVPSLGTMLETLELYCDRLIQYQNPQSDFYKMIMEKYQERSSCTENGGCNINGYGEPNTLQGLQSIYSYVGDHVTGSAGTGGYYYLDPQRAGFTGVYATHEEFVQKCQKVHQSGTPSTIWEQAQFTAYQVEQKIEKAKSIFGENAGKYMF